MMVIASSFTSQTTRLMEKSPISHATPRHHPEIPEISSSREEVSAETQATEGKKVTNSKET